jgi:hypothetical protein
MFRLTRQEQIFIVCVMTALVICTTARAWWRARHPLKITVPPPELFRDTPKNSKSGPIEDHD